MSFSGLLLNSTQSSAGHIRAAKVVRHDARIRSGAACFGRCFEPFILEISAPRCTSSEKFSPVQSIISSGPVRPYDADGM